MGTKREKDFILRLVDFYREMPYLYNKNDLNYRNKTMRNKGLQSLLEIYKKYDSDATVKTLRRKFDNMRTSYAREYKKVQESKQAGSAEVYEPTLWYYDAFSFLDPIAKPYTRVSDPLKYDEPNTSFSTIEEIDTTNLVVPFKKMKTETPVKTEPNPINKTEQSLPRQQDDWDILGKSIGLQLRDLDKRQLTISRKLISDVIYYASLNQLDEHSHVFVNTESADDSIQ